MMNKDDVSVIIPVYNGGKFIVDTLNQIKKLGYLDICTVIDDASRDNTADILRSWESQLGHVYYMPKNGQKIGTIKKTLKRMESEANLPKYVVLTDADTFLFNHDSKIALHSAIKFMETKNYAAIGLMDVPFNNNTLIQKLQYWEYLSDRAMHVFLGNKGHMRCIPGAGGIYRSDVLLKALESHSLRHAGDDMETTALVQRLGYKAGYYNNDFQARTIVPHSFSKLINQRIRWTVGALETYIKEHKYYASQFFKFHRLSWQILYETVKLITYAGWYWAIVKHPMFVALVGLGATYGLCLFFALVNPESKGQRTKAVFWIIPTSLMIYVVDTIRLPVAYITVGVNAMPRLEATTSWRDIWRLFTFQPIPRRVASAEYLGE